MESKLSKILSSLTVLAAWAYALGWIKTSYYFRSFGVGLESVEFSVQDYLFASWYVIENVIFFVFLLWIAGIARRVWVYAIVFAYLALPFLTDWSYSHLRSPAWGWLAGWLADVPHSILKFLPFAVVLAVLALNKETRAWFREPSWPHGNFALVALSIVAIAWSVSAAKHFGTADANAVLRNPAKSLLRVKLRVSESAPDLKPLETRPSLYLLYFGPHRCILFDAAGFAFGESGAHFTVFHVPAEKIEAIEGLRDFRPDPGRLFW